MKAVLLTAPQKVEIREVTQPELQGGDLLVEMQACGLCGSDLEKIEGEYTAAPPILGHEAVGLIAGVGEGTEGFEEGDRVFPHHHVPCYECVYCTRGSETMCPQYRRWHFEPGGFSEYFRVPAWIVSHGGVLHLPQTVSFEEGSFIEPLACCIRALERLQVPEAADVLVVGAGPMGMLVLRLLPHFGAGRVIVSEVSPKRIAFAERATRATVLNPTEVNLVQEVRDLTDGRGVDLAVVVTGNPRALVQSLEALRPGGRIGLIGIPEAGAPLPDVSRLVTREISIISSNAATERETRKALEMIAEGTVEVEDLVTHQMPLGEFETAVDLARGGEAMKVVVVPWGR